MDSKDGQDGGLLTLVTTIDGVSDRLVPLKRYMESVITIDSTSEIDTEKLAKRWFRWALQEREWLRIKASSQ